MIICYYAYVQITSAEFIRGITGPDKILEGSLPQIAFIGRSNVGKSSVINSLTQRKNLAKTSSAPGRTKEINLFLINRSFYLLDLPGYGFAKSSHQARKELLKLIDWYLFNSPYQQKNVVLIIDAYIGPTEDDLAMLQALEDFQKDIVIVANKIDKIKRANWAGQLQAIEELIGAHKVVPYSSPDRIGRNALTNELFNRSGK